MRKIRNPEGKLIAEIDEAAGVIRVARRGFITLLLLKPNSVITVRHLKKKAP
jgi:hypothetical protein